jgi:hypothetical protein
MAAFPFPCPILLSLAIVVCSVGCQVTQVQKVYFYNIYVWNCITCKLYFFMLYYKSFKLILEWIFSWIEIWMKRICWQPTPSNDVYFFFVDFFLIFKKFSHGSYFALYFFSFLPERGSFVLFYTPKLLFSRKQGFCYFVSNFGA